MTLHPIDGTSAGTVLDDGLFVFPCSRAQARFWALDQITPGNPSLNVAVRWRLRGRVDGPALQRAFDLLIERHEILRTRYHAVDGVPIQTVLPTVSFQLATIDLGLRPAPELPDAIDTISTVEANTGFDLANPPVLRATLLTLTPEEHILLVTVHHIASDGWSIGVLARDVLELYDAAHHGRPPTLPDLPIQYGDFAEWQNQTFEADPMVRARAYWTRQLAGFKPFEMPTDHPRSANPSGGAILARQLPRSLTDRMGVLGQRQGCTFFVVGLSALLAMLHGATGREDITLGTQIAGRDRVEVEHLVGPFINTVPLRFSVTSGLTFLALLDHVGQVVQDAMTYQDVPIEELIGIARPPRDPTRHPLFTCNVISQRSFIQQDVRPDIALIDMPSVSAGALYDLNFFFVERPDGWRMSCEYDTGLFELNSAERWLGGLQDRLERFIADPGQSLVREGRQDCVNDGVAGGVPAAQSTADGDVAGRIAERVAVLWAEILKLPAVHTTDNFFELGGHSLLALRFLSRVEKEFGRKLGIDALFAHPTVDAFAATLSRPKARKTDQDGIVTLQACGAKLPIFAIHDSNVFREIAEHLGPDQPFFAVPMPAGLETKVDLDYPAIAARYLQILQRFRPHGPYILLGLCFAARLAFEMTKQLNERGERVELLVAIDAWAPGYLHRRSRIRALLADWSYRLQRLVSNIETYWHGGSGRTMVIERGRLLAARRFRPRSGENATEDEQEFRRISWVDAVGRRHAARPLAVPLLVLHNDGQPRGPFLDRSLGWAELTDFHPEVRSVAARHGDILRGQAAASIARAITEAREMAR